MTDNSELDSGTVVLPDNIVLYWERNESGKRSYYVDGELIYSATRHSFVIAAACAIEETLSFEEKRIYGDGDS